jgi:hypothetical protein
MVLIMVHSSNVKIPLFVSDSKKKQTDDPKDGTFSTVYSYSVCTEDAEELSKHVAIIYKLKSLTT